MNPSYGRTYFRFKGKWRFCNVLFIAILLLRMPLTAWSAEDFRMTVDIPAEGQASTQQPSLSAIMRLATPVLWDRLLLQTVRARAVTLTGMPRMVSRIVPAERITKVQFDRQAVFDYLERAHMPYIASPPSFHLVIRMRNSVGMPMPQTEALLIQYARNMAQRWGFELSESAPDLIISWAWTDAHQVKLSLEGAAAPQDKVIQDRDVGAEDPLAFMQAWLKRILLDTRDRLGAGHQQAQGSRPDGQASVWLFIEKPLSLGEQAVLEDAIRSDPRVVRLVPHMYSRQHLRYRLVVAGYDTAWVTDWFRQRAFQVSPQTDGLSVR